MAKKKKRTSRKISWPEAVQHHQAVFDFLHQGDLLGNLMDGLKPGKEEVIVSTLATSRRPVLIGKLAEAADVSDASISQALDSINKCLSMFSSTHDVLLKGGIEIQIPGSGKSDETRFGYYLAFCNRRSGDPLTFKNPKELKDKVYFSYIRSVLRYKLKAEAHEWLAEKFGDPINDYQDLDLEVGIIEEAPSFHNTDRRNRSEGRELFEHTRSWKLYDMRSLLKNRGAYLLSSNTGTGKTAFLRYLQHRILVDGKGLPIFLDAEHLEKWDYRDMDSLILCLAEYLHPWFPTVSLDRFLSHEFHRRVLLLVDGLDQIRGVDSQYEHILTRLLRVCKENLIVASRPTAVERHRTNPNIKFLRLKPFSEGCQKEYFGEHYERACQICKKDRSLLGVPLLAHMVRTLIVNGQDSSIDNRASLYGRFINHVVLEYEHGGFTKQSERFAVRRYLEEISYIALEKDVPIQRISLDYCWELINKKYKDLEIDMLPKYGLVNLIPGKHLRFTHQSFQEYLAAEWVIKRKGRVDQVLSQYWDPKWREVIKFLVGLGEGESIIRTIYPGLQRDDCIHSRLFCAAECAQELVLTKKLETQLRNDLAKQLYVVPFDADAVVGLTKLGSFKSKNVAWESFVKGHWDSRVAADRVAKDEILKPLLSEKRLDWLLRHLYSVSFFNHITSSLLKAWSWAIGSHFVDVIIGELENCNKDVCWTAGYLLREMGHSLQDRQVEAVFRKLEHENAVVQIATLCALEGLEFYKNQKRLRKIVLLLEDSNPEVVRAAFKCLLGGLAHLSEKHLDKVAAKCFDVGLGEEDALKDILENSGARFNSPQVDKFVEKLRDSDWRVRKMALSVIKYHVTELTSSQLDEVFALRNDPAVAPEAITVAAQCPHLGRNQIREILSLLKTDRHVIRASVMQSVRFLMRYIRNHHIGSILAAYAYDDLKLAVLDACSNFGDRLSDDHIEYLLKGLGHIPEHDRRNGQGVFSRYARILHEEHYQEILDKIENAADPYEIIMLLNFLDARSMTHDALLKLLPLLDYRVEDGGSVYIGDIVRYAAYDKLREGHMAGLLAAF